MDAPKDEKHQLYINVVPTYESWMSQLPGDTPFWTLCLPGAHDAGMNTTQALDIIDTSAKALAVMWIILTTCFAWLGPLAPAAGFFAGARAEYIMIWFGGLTQHDTLAPMLQMGIR